MNNYLIPANSKKSILILGFFTPFDLGLFAVGIVISVILLLVFKSQNVGVMLALASPAMISAFLVAPVPNYHNVMTFLGNIYRFYSRNRKYYWRGWCVKNENRETRDPSNNNYIKF